MPLAAHAAAKPADRYALAGGCYGVRSEDSSAFLLKGEDGYTGTAAGVGSAEPFRFQATDLGEYLLYGRERDFFAAGSGQRPSSDDEPSRDAVWLIAEARGGAFTIRSVGADRALAVHPGSGEAVLVEPGSAGGAELFTFRRARGCPAYPEVELNAIGTPAKGELPYGEVSGMAETHMHTMAFEFIGGQAHCGRPWHRYGVTHALVDCPDHYPNGSAAVLENVLAGGDRPTHDPVGWPTFRDWPAPDSLTHEQSYYKWIERAWMGGLRLYVDLMVDNAVLCDIYPWKHNPCDEMSTVRLQIRRMYELQDYIDAQEGGPGEGWFRVVTDPYRARRVINRGKLAVVLGIEVSELFGCGLEDETPTCSRRDIDRGLKDMHKAGIRQMELINKFDNGLAGVAGDSGAFGVFTNTGNKYATGKYWQYETCTTDHEHAHDREFTAHTGAAQQDEIFGAGFQAFLPAGQAPVYPEPPHCNVRGLSDLGEYLIRRMMKKGMVFDPDHMSVRARDQALNLLESKRYSGIISSHSWSTPDSFPRIYDLGGVIGPSTSDTEGFLRKWQELKPVRNKRFHFGIGYGADANGFANQPRPRLGAENPVHYPFNSFDGSVRFERQQSGERTFGVNLDGVAHYGLHPDWIEDLRMAGGEGIVEDLSHGAEAYLQMWERAEGAPRPRCRTTHTRFKGGGIGRVHLGDAPKQLLERAGQPRDRSSRGWVYCIRHRGKSERQVPVFTPGGKVGLIATTARGQRGLGIRIGMPVRRVASIATRAGRGRWSTQIGRRGARLVYGVKRGRVSYIALADRSVAAKRSRLTRYLKLAGVR